MRIAVEDRLGTFVKDMGQQAEVRESPGRLAFEIAGGAEPEAGHGGIIAARQMDRHGDAAGRALQDSAPPAPLPRS